MGSNADIRSDGALQYIAYYYLFLSFVFVNFICKRKVYLFLSQSFIHFYDFEIYIFSAFFFFRCWFRWLFVWYNTMYSYVVFVCAYQIDIDGTLNDSAYCTLSKLLYCVRV